ncbi:hypothetical protein IFR05_016943, partial [Cadophora sp. M221]
MLQETKMGCATVVIRLNQPLSIPVLARAVAKPQQSSVGGKYVMITAGFAIYASRERLVASPVAILVIMQNLYIENWTTGGEDQDLEIRVRGPGVVFCIQYSPKSIKAPVLLEQHLDSLQALETDAGSEVANQLIIPFGSLMARLIAEVGDVASNLLSDYLYPKCFVLEARAGAEDRISTPLLKGSITGPELALPGGNIRGPRLANMKLEEWVTNIYSSCHISLAPSSQRLDHGPTQVLADGKPFFFKRFGQPPGGIYRELCTYRKIKEAMAFGTISPGLRICHLHGIVIDKDDKIPETSSTQRLVGILLTFIKTDKPSRMGTLVDMVRAGNVQLKDSLAG